MSVAGLEARVAALPCWRGKVRLGPLSGGLSNTAFVVDDGRERFVARCGGDIPVHHVFRERERAASIAAHAAGLSPELIYAEPGVMVVRYVEGRTFVEADLPANLERIVDLLTTCHRTLPRHLAGPANAFWVVPLRPVFGHHDLLPGNFIDDGKRLWLIDWEYGGFGTAMFDLANLATHDGFGADDDVRLLEAYFEPPVPAGLRRAFDAMKAASALREAAWAMVSAIHLSVPGVDYRAHAAEYLRRADALLSQCIERNGSLAV